MKQNSQKSLKIQILNESVQILGTLGFEGLSLREVAKKLNVTHQAPYHYFSDKAALLLELKTEGFKRMNASMAEAASKAKPDIRKLERMGLAYFDFCLQNPGYFRAMFAATATGQNIRVPEAEKAFLALQSTIEELQKQKAIRNQKSEILALICWTYLHGYVSLVMEKYPVGGGKYPPRDLAQKMIHEMSLLLGS